MDPEQMDDMEALMEDKMTEKTAKTVEE
jgi:hypothetical protein